MDTEFIENWAKFINEHSDKEWSNLQKEPIDSQIENAKNKSYKRADSYNT